MTDLPARPVPFYALTPREIAVTSLVAKRWTTKRIACELGVSERCIQAHLSAVAFKITVPPGEDDRQYVADWWRAQLGADAA